MCAVGELDRVLLVFSDANLHRKQQDIRLAFLWIQKSGGERSLPQFGEGLLVVVNVSLGLPLELLGKVFRKLLVIVLSANLLAGGIDDLVKRRKVMHQIGESRRKKGKESELLAS